MLYVILPSVSGKLTCDISNEGNKKKVTCKDSYEITAVIELKFVLVS